MECPPPPPPVEAACFRGACANSTRLCACDAGWLDVGDFAPGVGACLINATAVQVVWGVGAVIHAFVVARAAFYLRDEWAFSSAATKQTRVRLVWYFAAFQLFEHATLLIIAALKASSPSTRTLGADVAVTLLFFVGIGTGWFATVCVLYNLVRMQLQSARVMLMVQGSQLSQESSSADNHAHKLIFVDNRKLVALVLTVGWTAVSTPVFMLIDPTSVSLHYSLGVVYYAYVQRGRVHVN